jgi:hypothetical protein
MCEARESTISHHTLVIVLLAPDPSEHLAVEPFFVALRFFPHDENDLIFQQDFVEAVFGCHFFEDDLGARGDLADSLVFVDFAEL